MPNYTFKCPNCREEENFFLDYTTMKVMEKHGVPCHFCNQGVLMERSFKATSTALQTKEVIDNGLLPKKVERLADISEMVKQRADNDKS